MAWTTPKTWSNLDPLVASEFNTQFRDNLNELRAQTEDVQPKVTAQQAIFTGSTVHRAVYDMSTNRNTSSQSLARIDSTLVLTFTPVSDLVLFTVQFAVRMSEDRSIKCGVWKNNAAYSLPYTGGGGSADAFFWWMADEENVGGVNIGWGGMVHYVVPMPMVRGQVVSLYPSWASAQGGSINTRSEAPMILTAVDVGAYE